MNHRPRVIVTSPQQYASRLCGRLIDAGMRPLWTPGVHTAPLPASSPLARALDAAVAPLLLQQQQPAPAAYDYVAFTSRAGIEAVMASIARQLPNHDDDAAPSSSSSSSSLAAGAALASSGARVCALGADGELLQRAHGVVADVNPLEDASTMGLVRALEREFESAKQERRPRRHRRPPRVLCPVPLVSHGLREPPVVPRFLAALEEAGAEPVRADAYLTVPGLLVFDDDDDEGDQQRQNRRRRAAAGRAAEEERRALAAGEVDAVVFSSTAEAQGLALQFYWAEHGEEMELRRGEEEGKEEGQEEEEQQELRRAAAALRRLLAEAGARRASRGKPAVVLAAHGPTTAAGVAEALGLPPSDSILVSKDWSSFAGVTDALAEALGVAPGGGGGTRRR